MSTEVATLVYSSMLYHQHQTHKTAKWKSLADHGWSIYFNPGAIQWYSHMFTTSSQPFPINSVALAMFHLWAFTLPENSTLRWFNRQRGLKLEDSTCTPEGPKRQLLTKLGAGHSTRVGSRKKGLKHSSEWHQNLSKSAWDSNLTFDIFSDCLFIDVFESGHLQEWACSWTCRESVSKHGGRLTLTPFRFNRIVTCNKSTSTT